MAESTDTTSRLPGQAYRVGEQQITKKKQTLEKRLKVHKACLRLLEAYGSRLQSRVGLPDARLLTIYPTVLPLSSAAIIFANQR